MTFDIHGVMQHLTLTMLPCNHYLQSVEAALINIICIEVEVEICWRAVQRSQHFHQTLKYWYA